MSSPVKITFCCFKCGEEMEISPKMAGKRVRCVECDALADVPQPGKRRKYTEEEKAFLRSTMEKADRELEEEERKEAEDSRPHVYVSTASGSLWGAEVSLSGGIVMILVAVAWFVGG